MNKLTSVIIKKKKKELRLFGSYPTSEVVDIVILCIQFLPQDLSTECWYSSRDLRKCCICGCDTLSLDKLQMLFYIVAKNTITLF